MSKLVGNWILEKNENWDGFLEAAGTNFVIRKLANTVTIKQEIKQNGEDWEINMTSSFKNKSMKFKLGVPFEDTAMDGRKIEVTVTLEEDDTLVVNQRNLDERKRDLDTRVTRRVDGNDKLIETFHLINKGVTAVKTSKRYTP